MSSKIALVTGASSGIGKATAEVLARRGYKLILVGRRLAKLRQLCEALGTQETCLPLQCDFFEIDRIAAALQSIPAELQQVDVLINNAGNALGFDTAQQSDWQDWERMINLNCTALARVTHYFLPGMVARNSGHIVNLGSVAAVYPYKSGNVYGASKAFVAMFSRNLKVDLLGTAVRVTNIEPGMVSDTEFTDVRVQGDAAKVEAIKGGVNALRAVDIANTIDWVLQQPAHVNINRVELMPVAQAAAGLAYHRVNT
ncbi:MAG: SDR family NAD(P)-dependent oxidoreductase [Gammaproteobacteria bacterium]|nr:SDR family NAD(P)-dependent oxidoreductase [Gammaproteobacteria bacterium]MDH5304642.1 SDR family NAD(P)-dependent oxidoreductase [Gammaproteobacteria bacterium]MDH5322501.1 SDR family NAD(P)-dependent oxidoreductase [Gammaproteobacteria bacterium]